jgi:hypothetical protein
MPVSKKQKSKTSNGDTKPAMPAEPEDAAQDVASKIRKSVQHNWHLLPPELTRQGFNHQFPGAVLKETFPFAVTAAAGKPDEPLIQAYAIRHLADVLERMKAADPVEEMLITQLVWTHARVARLTMISKQEGMKQLTAVAGACDSASNTFRRLMLALAEYRNPRRQHFTAIGQFNAAAQQVVQQAVAAHPAQAPGDKSEKENEKATNEKGSEAAATPLLPDGNGLGFASKLDPTRETVDVDAWPGDTGGETAVKPQRAQARAADPGGNG